MIITSSNVEMKSNHQYQEMSKTEEEVRFWKGGNPTAAKPVSSSPAALALPVDSVDISTEAAATKYKDSLREIPEPDEIKLRALIKMLEALMGKKLKVMAPIIWGQEDQQRIDALRNSMSRIRVGWGLEYNYSHTYFEEESVSYDAKGVVTTADGREISFSISMNMSRSFYYNEEFHLQLGDAARPIDPLVVNFNAAMAGLSQDKFAFDLDNDGQTEMISFVNPGSGFLALDLNNDGIINNGGELFGPATGNGFTELSQYDSDGNNWIDENDPIYDKLRIWTKDENGNDVLFALGQVGVGAIFLGSASTPFTFKDSANEAHGQLQSTGIFLHENGQAGIIQQIDLFA